MASGTISLGTSKKIEGRITWESTPNNTANTSQVKATLQVRRVDTYTTLGTWKGALNVGGTSESYSYYGGVSGWVTVKTLTVTKTHSADGTGTCYISGSITAPTETSQEGAKVSGSKTVTLDTIPRASSISASNADIGKATTISISRHSDKFTHTLKYSFEGLTGTIVSKTTSVSYRWTVPTSFYAKIPNAKSGVCTITCETYSGNTLVGTKTDAIIVTAALSDCRPTLDPVIEDSNNVTVALTGDSKKLIRYYSTAHTVSNAESRNSATLKSQKTTNGNKTIATEIGAFNNVESNKFTFTATDSRGYTTTVNKTVTMINYIKLTCGLANTEFNTDGVISFNIKGNYFNSSFGVTSNVLLVSYRYKLSDGSYSNWISVEPTITNNTYTASVSITGLDYRSKYVVQARAIDELATISSSQVTLSCIPVFDWGAEDFNFNVPVTMNWNGYSYDLLGLFRAMTTTYTPECTVTPGENYSSATVTAHLTGCNLRIGVSATRNASLAAGNFSNETVCTVDIDHGGKLANLYRVSFNTSTSGGVATLDCQATKVSDNVVRITINLCAAAQALTDFNAYFAMPCTIVTKAYV